MRTSTPCLQQFDLSRATRRSYSPAVENVVPATVVTGATTFNVNTERPVFETEFERPRTLSFRPCNEIDRTSVELRIAHHQTFGQRHAHPTVGDHINGQASFASGEIAVDFQVVIDAARVASTGGGSGSGSAGDAARLSAAYSVTGKTTQPSGSRLCFAQTPALRRRSWWHQDRSHTNRRRRSIVFLLCSNVL